MKRLSLLLVPALLFAGTDANPIQAQQGQGGAAARQERVAPQSRMHIEQLLQSMDLTDEQIAKIHDALRQERQRMGPLSGTRGARMGTTHQGQGHPAPGGTQGRPGMGRMGPPGTAGAMGSRGQMGMAQQEERGARAPMRPGMRQDIHLEVLQAMEGAELTEADRKALEAAHAEIQRAQQEIRDITERIRRESQNTRPGRRGGGR